MTSQTVKSQHYHIKINGVWFWYKTFYQSFFFFFLAFALIYLDTIPTCRSSKRLDIYIFITLQGVFMSHLGNICFKWVDLLEQNVIRTYTACECLGTHAVTDFSKMCYHSFTHVPQFVHMRRLSCCGIWRERFILKYCSFLRSNAFSISRLSFHLSDSKTLFFVLYPAVQDRSWCWRGRTLMWLQAHLSLNHLIWYSPSSFLPGLWIK